MKKTYIINGIRTPIGNYQGALSTVRTINWATLSLPRSKKTQTFRKTPMMMSFRLCQSAGEDNRNVARMALLLAGLPVTLPGEDGKPSMQFRIISNIHANRAIKPVTAIQFIAGVPKT